MSAEFVALAAAIFIVALLYSSVGHAGASGYIAVLTLFGFGVEVIRPTALTLNILVAAIGFIQWWRGGHFVWSLFWPRVVVRACGLLRRMARGAGVLPEDLDRPRALVFRVAFALPQGGPAGHGASGATDGRGLRRGHRVFVRPDRYRRRNFSHAAAALLPLGQR